MNIFRRIYQRVAVSFSEAATDYKQAVTALAADVQELRTDLQNVQHELLLAQHDLHALNGSKFGAAQKLKSTVHLDRVSSALGQRRG